MENMKLESYEPVVYIKEECTHLSALNPIDLNIQDVEDEFGDKSEHKVYCSLTVVNPEEITCDSVGSEDYNSDWVFGLQTSCTTSTDGVNHTPVQSVKNNEPQPIQPISLVECDLSNDSTFSRLNDNSSSDNSNMYTYYSLPNDSSLVNFSHHDSPHKRVDFRDWNNVVPEQKKVITKVEKSPVKKTFLCPTCNKMFASKSNLERHGIVHSDVKPFKCVECDRMFSRRVHLDRHKFLHMEQKPFSCEICKRGFNQKTHMEKHQYIHTGVKPFSCTLCPKTFARKESLNRHQAVHAANEKKLSALAVDNKNMTDRNLTAKRKESTTQNKTTPGTNDNTPKKNNLEILKAPDKVQPSNKVATNVEERKNVQNEKMDTSEVVV